MPRLVRCNSVARFSPILIWPRLIVARLGLQLGRLHRLRRQLGEQADRARDRGRETWRLPGRPWRDRCAPCRRRTSRDSLASRDRWPPTSAAGTRGRADRSCGKRGRWGRRIVGCGGKPGDPPLFGECVEERGIPGLPKVLSPRHRMSGAQSKTVYLVLRICFEDDDEGKDEHDFAAFWNAGGEGESGAYFQNNYFHLDSLCPTPCAKMRGEI